MHIAIERDAPFPSNTADHLLTVEDSRVQELIGELPLAIQVAAEQRTAVVSENHSVRVKHRNHLEHKVLAKFLR